MIVTPWDSVRPMVEAIAMAHLDTDKYGRTSRRSSILFLIVPDYLRKEF